MDPDNSVLLISNKSSEVHTNTPQNPAEKLNQWRSPPEYFWDNTTEETMSKNLEASALLLLTT